MRASDCCGQIGFRKILSLEPQRQAVLNIQIGVLLKAAQPRSASTADRAQSLEPGCRMRSHGSASPYPAVNEFRPGLLRHLPNFFTTDAGRTRRPRCFETADRHHRDIRTTGEFVLLYAEQGTGGADLLWSDLHERIRSR